ncbi:unnamed protein product [Lepidochelys kempii]
MLPKAVVTNGHTEHSTTAANEPNVPPEKWQQKRLVRQKEKLRSNLLKSGFQFLDRFVELLKEMEDVPKDTKKKYLQKGIAPAAPIGHSSPFPADGSCRGGACRQEQHVETPPPPPKPRCDEGPEQAGACLGSSPAAPPKIASDRLVITD